LVYGLAELTLAIPGAKSLKDKRQVIRGLIQRLSQRHRVSVAEVDDQGLWNRATIGVALVTNDAAYAESVLAKIESEINATPELEILDVWREIERR
jgi:uncharacterized protein YlxP (DUF503 family)